MKFASTGDVNVDLPEELEPLNDEEIAFQVFAWEEFVEWRHLPMPGGLLNQPEALMSDLLTLKGLLSKIQSQMDKRNKTS